MQSRRFPAVSSSMDIAILTIVRGPMTVHREENT